MTPETRTARARTTRLFRKAVVVFYWIATPLVLLLSAGWLLGAMLVPSSPSNLLMAFGSAAFGALLAWRLWLNRRALGHAGPMPSARRLATVYLPLSGLAFAGVMLVALGLTATIFSLWLAFGPVDYEPRNPVDDEVAVAWLTGTVGVVAMLIGAGLCWPLLRRLIAKPASPSSLEAPPDLDTTND